MLNSRVSCFHQQPPPARYRKLSLLLLDCWQREYDKRPYRYFHFNRLEFEGRLDRTYDSVRDFITIIVFLTKRCLCSMKLVGLCVESSPSSLLYNFAASLQKLRHIELKSMSLPLELFELLAANVDNMSVAELSFEGTPLSDDDIICLRSFVIKSTTLKILNVAACNINQYNFAILADGIHKSNSLISINISRLIGLYLTLDSDKIAHVISSLIWQNKLQEIILEKCELIEQDMETIAEYLANDNAKLIKLNLAGNKIGPQGCECILEAIAKSKTLKYLNLNGCHLGTKGGEIVSKYLSSYFHLDTLMLQNNQMDAEAVNMILLTINKSYKLKELHLVGNKYNPRTGDILKRLLDSEVMPQNIIDLTAAFDDTIPGYRVIPFFG